MNIEIRRQGIVIKTIAVSSERVRIGSGEECEIQLKDPFLSPVVAEMVKRGGEWRMIDAGTSLEGMTRGGVRIMDERVAPGEPYMVGAFELVVAPELGRNFATRAADGVVPHTMMEDLGGIVPSTLVQPNPARNSPPTAAAPGKLAFTPVATPQGAPADARRKSKSTTGRRLLLVVAAAFTTICVSLAVIMSNAPKRPAKKAPAPNGTAAQTTATAPPAPVASGDELAANLDIDKAFAAWEKEFGARPSTELRDKIVRGAFELGRAHAAAHDAQTASRYFQKVVRYGDPNSEWVRIARARLNSPQ